MSRILTVAIAGVVSLFLLTGCPPKYPKCDKDEHCKEGEFCVNGLCQQCRTDQDCGTGNLCKGGRCEPGCRSSDDCPGGQACINYKCVPCQSDNDCGPGGRCRQGRCLKPGQCATDEDCPENHECQNGICVAPPPAPAAGPCTPKTVYFDFNESVLTSEATATLQGNVDCIKSVAGRRVRLEGHCDPRGTEEYNMALGDRRARSVQRYLTRLGIPANRLRPVSKGKLEATGSDEASWALDRKVMFIWE
jgi:peptidoglycan-associated lipoprotein